ncbi:hypothetical protein T4D_10988 [Trichinella pseudospiralis]|uniref:Uncharacterized protein n=1 Tax=Trichinella pseudospiralis TaxID=6337 RepID=A0A0V1F6F4_TRIPS|nr:hypothetical protein T4D_10988 [Trichinella pseudospiralis]
MNLQCLHLLFSIPTSIAEMNVFVGLLSVAGIFHENHKNAGYNGVSIKLQEEIHSDAIGWHTVRHFSKATFYRKVKVKYARGKDRFTSEQAGSLTTLKCRNREASLKKTL